LLGIYGRVVECASAPQGTPDQAFNWMAGNLEEQTIILADPGFRDFNGIPANLILCAKAQRSERMPDETARSTVTVIADLK
jgi:hypothetical protein